MIKLRKPKRHIFMKCFFPVFCFLFAFVWQQTAKKERFHLQFAGKYVILKPTERPV